MRIKSNIVLSDGRLRVYKGGRGTSKIISSDTWYEENEGIEDIWSFLCEISIVIVRTFAYNKDR